MPTSLIPSAVRSPDGKHSESFGDLAILSIEGNEDLYRGEWTPLFVGKTGLFEGSGQVLSGARSTSCEA
jgi:hypothetical protein